MAKSRSKADSFLCGANVSTLTPSARTFFRISSIVAGFSSRAPSSSPPFASICAKRQ